MPIRVRAALVFVTALAIAFGLGGWLFYTQLSASLLGVSLEDSSRTLGSATHGLLIGGAAFLILADLAARTVQAPDEIPIGVVTALVGAPFFLFVLRSKRARQGVL